MKKRQLLGVDIGEGTVRLAAVEPSTGEIVFSAGECWTSGEEKAEALRRVFRAAGTERDLVISFPEAWLFSRTIDLPQLKKGEVESAINSRLKKYFDFHEEGFTVSFSETSLSSGGGRKKGYFVTVIEKAIIDEYLTLLRALGLTIHHVEMPHAALLRWLTWEKPELKKGVHLALHLVPGSPLIAGFRDGELLLGRRVFQPLPSLPEWREAALPATEELEPFLADFARHVQSLASYLRFRTMDLEIEPRELLVSGLHSDDKAFVGFLRARLDLPVVEMAGARMRAAPEPCAPADYQQWAIAGGLSLRIMEESTWSL